MSKYDHNQIMLMFDLAESAKDNLIHLGATSTNFLSQGKVRGLILACINDLTELSNEVHQANVETTYTQRATQLEFQFQSESKKRAEDILLNSRLTGNRPFLHYSDVPPPNWQDQSITLWKRPVYLYWPSDPRAGFGLGIQLFDTCRNL